MLKHVLASPAMVGLMLSSPAQAPQDGGTLKVGIASTPPTPAFWGARRSCGGAPMAVVPPLMAPVRFPTTCRRPQALRWRMWGWPWPDCPACRRRWNDCTLSTGACRWRRSPNRLRGSRKTVLPRPSICARSGHCASMRWARAGRAPIAAQTRPTHGHRSISGIPNSRACCGTSGGSAPTASRAEKPPRRWSKACGCAADTGACLETLVSAPFIRPRVHAGIGDDVIADLAAHGMAREISARGHVNHPGIVHAVGMDAAGNMTGAADDAWVASSPTPDRK